MPKPSLHTLIWSQLQQAYELRSQGPGSQWFRPGDEEALSGWLQEQTSFAFVGQAGPLSVIKEARSRGTGYWYAYRRQDRRTRKRYLGSTARVTLARLEQVARALDSEPEPVPLLWGQRVQEQETPLAHRPTPEAEEARSNAGLLSEPRLALLSSKLSPPRLPTLLVERSHLLEDLNAALTHPLTLVSASAGSGKTTLLSAWAASRRAGASQERAGGAQHVVAWLSLDALDNNPIRFWTAVIAALQIGLPTLGEMAQGMLHSPQAPPLSAIVTCLLNEILEVGRDIILILDDSHVISDQTTCDSMLFLLDHLSANLHLVLARRSDPAFPLSRWRVRGQLIEIRDPDLRFSQEEASSFLMQSMGLPLSVEDVARLQQRTEGWIAGLQLAALSLRKQNDLSGWIANFAGSHCYLLDYVQQDILAWLPTRLQSFLLQTSILTRMTARLCQAVTAAGELQASQEMLLELERANLFVVPLDEQRQWYRYHDLFREALHARLQASQRELVPRLHQRAAHWYEAAGEWREAITHALAAPDYPLAASLLELAAPAFWLSGEARTVQNWVLTLPDAVLRAHTHLALSAALRLFNSLQSLTKTVYAGMVAQVERTLSRMEALLLSAQEAALSEAEAELIERRVRLLHALIEGWEIHKRGDKEHLRLLSQKIEALPPDEEEIWNLIPLTFTYWLMYAYQREAAHLVPRLLAAKQQMREAGDHLATIRIMNMLAAAYTDAGQLHQVHRECMEGLALLKQLGGRTVRAGYLYLHLFFVYYSWNRLEEALDALHHLLRITQDWQEVDLQVMGECALVRLSLARGDLATAQQALQKVEVLVAQEGYAFHAPWMVYARVPWWLAQGNLAEACEWAAQTEFSEETWNPTRKWEALMRVRISLAQQQYSDAVETLSRFSRYLDRPGDIPTTIAFLALQVVALSQSGKRELGVRIAARLLALTEPGGYIRVYLDAGEPMKQVLQALLASAGKGSQNAPQDDDHRTSALAISRSSVLRLLSAFEQEEKKHVPGAAAPLDRQQPALLEPTENAPSTLQPAPSSLLSPQELKVLRLLVAGQTYAQMAQVLIVSPNTIKTQVSSIYRKLGVSRRAEAIAATQRLHLLSPRHFLAPS